MGDRAANMPSTSPALAGESREDGVVPSCCGRDDLDLGTTSSKGRESRNDLPLTTNLNCESSLNIVFCDTEPNGLVVPSSSSTGDPILDPPPPLDPMTHPTTIPMETSPTLFLVVADIRDGDEATIHAACAEGGGGFDDGEGGAQHPSQGRSMSDDDDDDDGDDDTAQFSMPSSTADEALGIDW